LDEGQLQSWLDGELAPEAREPAASHIAVCRQCSAALDALQAGDSEVAAKLEALADELPHPLVLYAPRRRWPAAAAAAVLAASLALALALPHPPAPQSGSPFLSLTDEPDPIQAGMLVRVSLPASAVPYSGAVPPSGMIQAELIVGEDGRPRAVRILPQ
jgi:anti-sigma factor RsiW